MINLIFQLTLNINYNRRKTFKFYVNEYDNILHLCIYIKLRVRRLIKLNFICAFSFIVYQALFNLSKSLCSLDFKHLICIFLIVHSIHSIWLLFMVLESLVNWNYSFIMFYFFFILFFEINHFIYFLLYYNEFNRTHLIMVFNISFLHYFISFMWFSV